MSALRHGGCSVAVGRDGRARRVGVGMLRVVARVLGGCRYQCPFKTLHSLLLNLTTHFTFT